MRSTVTRRLEKEALHLFLAFLLAAMPLVAGDPLPQAPAAPQTSAPPATATAVAQPGVPALPTVQGLKVIPLAGKGETNDLERKIMAPLVVEVLDQEDRPLEGAEVVFRFPPSGPGATFTGGKTSQTVRTNVQGQAAALNWLANSEVGKFDVHVTATYGNQVGETTFQMSNATKVVQRANIGNNPYANEKKGWFSPTWVKIAVIGGAAALAAGIVLATRGGGSKSAPTTITITPGAPTVGAPQ